MFDITVLESGNLEITLDAADESERLELIEEILELMERKDDLSILLDGTESYWSNGSFYPFDAGDGNPFVGLTSALMIAESLNFDDNGDAEIIGDCWHFGNYMVESFLDGLLCDGRVVFTICRQD